jgi:hypothetical protein
MVDANSINVHTKFHQNPSDSGIELLLSIKLTHIGLTMAVRITELKNDTTDLDEICYRRYAIGV